MQPCVHGGDDVAVASPLPPPTPLRLPASTEVVTAALDGTIRVWNNTSAEQLFEFSAPRESCRCVVFHPNAHVIACGFDNGFVRVFDVPTTRFVRLVPRFTYCSLASALTRRG